MHWHALMTTTSTSTTKATCVSRSRGHIINTIIIAEFVRISPTLAIDRLQQHNCHIHHSATNQMQHLPGWPSPTDSDVNRNVCPSSMSYLPPAMLWPFEWPFVCEFCCGILTGAVVTYLLGFISAGSTAACCSFTCWWRWFEPTHTSTFSSGWLSVCECGYVFFRLWNNVHANRRRWERWKNRRIWRIVSRDADHSRSNRVDEKWSVTLKSIVVCTQNMHTHAECNELGVCASGKCVRLSVWCRRSRTCGAGNFARLERSRNLLRTLGFWDFLRTMGHTFLAGLGCWLREIRLPTATTLLVEKRPRNLERSVFISSARLGARFRSVWRARFEPNSRLPKSLPLMQVSFTAAYLWAIRDKTEYFWITMRDSR